MQYVEFYLQHSSFDSANNVGYALHTVREILHLWSTAYAMGV